MNILIGRIDMHFGFCRPNRSLAHNQTTWLYQEVVVRVNNLAPFPRKRHFDFPTSAESPDAKVTSQIALSSDFRFSTATELRAFQSNALESGLRDEGTPKPRDGRAAIHQLRRKTPKLKSTFGAI
jgi:hypothetical protein